MNTRRFRTRTLAGLAGLALVVGPVAACGSEDDDSSSGSGGSSNSAPERVQAEATVDDLSQNGGMTQIMLDQGFLDALMSLKLTPGVALDAKLNGTTLTFPITGGNVSLFKPGSVPNYVVGQLQHENSGLTLSAQGGPTVTIGNFNVDPGESVVYGDVLVDDQPAAQSVPLFNLDGSTLNPVEMQGSDVILQGTTIFVSKTAADLLNSTFGTDAVTDQLKVGVAKITVATA